MIDVQRVKHFLHISEVDRIGYGLIAIWVLSMISLPIFLWTLGDAVLPIGITISAILQATAVFVITYQNWGFNQTLRTFLLVAFLSWGAEFIGSNTGIPFGAYHYTHTLQPQIFGVPLLIPLAWFMLLPPCWALAQQITGERKTLSDWMIFAIISGLALTAWDLFLDPQMVNWGFWEWEINTGGYFGIPWSNYFGWVLVATIISFVAKPADLKPMPLVLVYGFVWFLQSFGQAFFWNQVGPAFVGFIAMGSMLALAYWRSQKVTAQS